jgi:hypothetical protein
MAVVVEQARLKRRRRRGSDGMLDGAVSRQGRVPEHAMSVCRFLLPGRPQTIVGDGAGECVRFEPCGEPPRALTARAPGRRLDEQWHDVSADAAAVWIFELEPQKEKSAAAQDSARRSMCE